MVTAEEYIDYIRYLRRKSETQQEQDDEQSDAVQELIASPDFHIMRRRYSVITGQPKDVVCDEEIASYLLVRYDGLSHDGMNELIKEYREKLAQSYETSNPHEYQDLVEAVKDLCDSKHVAFTLDAVGDYLDRAIYKVGLPISTAIQCMHDNAAANRAREEEDCPWSKKSDLDSLPFV